MRAHDDYLDLKQAIEVWERAYQKWGETGDELCLNANNREKAVKLEKKAIKAADRYMVACDTLAQMAQRARQTMLDAGWKPVGAKRKPASAQNSTRRKERS